MPSLFLAAAGVLLWPMLALSTAMMFDAPGSERNPITRLLALSIVTYLIWTILGNVLFWMKRSSAPVGWLVAFTVVPPLVLLTALFRYFMRKAYRQIRVKIARLYAHLQESIIGMEVIHHLRIPSGTEGRDG